MHVVVNAIAAVLAMEDKEFCKVGELAVAVMIETASIITGDAYRVKASQRLQFYCVCYIPRGSVFLYWLSGRAVRGAGPGSVVKL